MNASEHSAYLESESINSLFPTTPEHTSEWRFPPAVNRDFFVEWYRKKDREDQIFDVVASRNFTELTENDFGFQDAVVHVGDVIEASWREEGGERNVLMDCVVCTEGGGENEPGGTGMEGHDALRRVYEACGNYTDTAHRSTFDNSTDAFPPGASYTLPPLSHTLDLPENTVGICHFSLDYNSHDVSIPFPVAQQLRSLTPPFRFSKEHPTGIPDPTILLLVGTSTVASSQERSAVGGGLGTGAIVGIVFGVLLGICLSALVGWFAWRREKRRSKKMGRDDGSPSPQHNHDGNGGERGDGTELQRVERGGVEREVERDEDGEVPPAYHEAVMGTDKQLEAGTVTSRYV